MGWYWVIRQLYECIRVVQLRDWEMDPICRYFLLSWYIRL